MFKVSRGVDQRSGNARRPCGVIIALDSDPTITHLHVWCDDTTTSVAWADTNRANSPLSSFFAAAYPLGSLPVSLNHYRMNRGGAQCDGGCDPSSVSGLKRGRPPEWPVSGLDLPALTNATSLIYGYQRRLRNAAKRHIHHHLLHACRNGWRKYLEFCTIFGLEPLLPGAAWPDIFECFLLYAVEDALRKIAPFTSNEYVSHVLKHLEHEGLWKIRPTARSERYTAVLRALLCDHAANHMYRTDARIPFTVPFILWSLFDYIDRTYQAPPNHVCSRLSSLRPGEYLKCS
jgi:hypothetical protein